MAEEKKKCVTLVLTEEQKQAVEAFFAFNNWDFIVLEESILDDNSDNISSASVSGNTSGCGGNHEGDVNDDGDRQRQEDNPEQEYVEYEDGQCEYCLCNPCVTSSRQAWLGNGQVARPGNSAIRKTKYKKFWKLLDTRGAWKHPVYLERKKRAAEENNESDIWVIREIMPMCVLSLVRSLYPNPDGIPYMGHKWT